MVVVMGIESDDHETGRRFVLEALCEALGWSFVPLTDALAEVRLLRAAQRKQFTEAGGDNGKPYSIGSKHWTGISKLIEESGEVVQVCGKILGTGGEVSHWDGTNLKERLEDELADLQAAIAFVIFHNQLDAKNIEGRTEAKLRLFTQWHQAGQ